MNPAAPVPAVSEPITLSPGVMLNGSAVTEARVRLITRADRSAASKEPEDNRESFILARQIASFGSSRDQTLIASAVDHLTAPDEARLRNAISELEAVFFLAPTLDKQGSVPVVPTSDILSEEFSLNPGIVVNEVEYKTARIRMVTRGQWKEIQAAPDADRDDLTLFYAIASLGGEVPQRDWVMMLTDVDVERINNEITELRERYAPAPKSACPYCGRGLATAELEDTALGADREADPA